MVCATLKDKSAIVEILCDSFSDNQSVSYITKGKASRIKALMEYSFDVCLNSGLVFMSQNRKACALVMFHDKTKTSIKSIWIDIVFIVKGLWVKDIFKALKREKMIKEKLTQKEFYHLWYIGVESKSQNMGIGSILLRDLIDDAKSKNRKVFLETSKPQNLAWYKNFGFKVYDYIDLGYRLFFLAN